MAPDGTRSRRLRVLVADEEGRPVSAPGIVRWLTRIAPARARGVVGVALVSDARVRLLNRRYRRKDHATDVLSFCAAPEPYDAKPRNNRRATPSADLKVGPAYPRYLGEIVIARGVARRQARAAGHTELTELRVLALHGLLHLLGYDHHGDSGRMARVEQTLRARGGLREGLIERAESPRRRRVARAKK